MSNGPFPYIMGVDFIAVTIGGKVYNIDVSNAQFTPLKNALRAKNWALVEKTVDLATAIRTWSKGSKLVVTDNEITYEGEVLSNGLTNHILLMIRDGFDASPMVKFLEKLMENPSFNSRNSLYRFVDANKITIHPDGDMILYKNVNRKKDGSGDLVDIHSGKFRNNVGDKPSVPRQSVDDNPNNLCSYGLHVCALRYLDHFRGDVTLLVKVNPKDVVSVPTDYQDSKMRVTTYEVIGIHEKGYFTEATESAVYGVDPEVDTDQMSEELYHIEDEWDASSSSCYSEEWNNSGCTY